MTIQIPDKSVIQIPSVQLFSSKDGSDPDTGLVEFNLDNLEDDSQNYEPPPQPSAK